MNSDIPEYMRESPPPPEIDEGQQVLGTIIDITVDTKRKFGYDQYVFDCTLDDYNGYNAKAWMRHYPEPGHKSYLGILCMNVEKYTGKSYSSLDSVMNALKNDVRKIYLRCSGHKEVEDTTFPRFKPVHEKLPPKQVSIESRTVAEPSGEEAVISKILATIPQMTRPAIEKMVAAECSKGIPRQASVYIVATNLGVTL